jgi:hypothetical protein
MSEESIEQQRAAFRDLHAADAAIIVRQGKELHELREQLKEANRAVILNLQLLRDARAELAESSRVLKQTNAALNSQQMESRRLEAQLAIRWQDLPGATAELVASAPPGLQPLMRQWVGEFTWLRAEIAERQRMYDRQCVLASDYIDRLGTFAAERASAVTDLGILQDALRWCIDNEVCANETTGELLGSEGPITPPERLARVIRQARQASEPNNDEDRPALRPSQLGAHWESGNG